MDIGRRLRQIRESKSLSQGAIEKRTGLLRCYVSRVECGHTVPMLDTVEKWAEALRVPLWEVFLGTEITKEPAQDVPITPYEKRLFGLLKKIGQRDRALFISVANKMARQRSDHGGPGKGRQERR